MADATSPFWSKTHPQRASLHICCKAIGPSHPVSSLDSARGSSPEAPGPLQSAVAAPQNSAVVGHRPPTCLCPNPDLEEVSAATGDEGSMTGCHQMQRCWIGKSGVKLSGWSVRWGGKLWAAWLSFGSWCGWKCWWSKLEPKENTCPPHIIPHPPEHTQMLKTVLSKYVGLLIGFMKMTCCNTAGCKKKQTLSSQSFGAHSSGYITSYQVISGSLGLSKTRSKASNWLWLQAESPSFPSDL